MNPTPQCDPAWTPAPTPHPLGGWIGGACEAVEQCGAAPLCLDREALPGGLCTETCERYCPDASGRVGTFCVDMGFADEGLCLPRCESDAGCREGWVCEARARFNEPEVVKSACVPAPTPEPAPEP